MKLEQMKYGAALVLSLAGAAAFAAPPAAAPQERPRVTRETQFASWGLSCAVAQDAKGKPAERCMISQLVSTNPKQGKVVLGITVDYADNPKTPTMRARFSAAAERRAGIGIKIDARPDMRLPISDCNAQRCEAVGRLAPDVLAAWRGGKLAQLAFIGQGGKQVLLPISLAGFDQALAALARYPGGRG
ncbi:MAG: invasion associated locus B family protein [Pseudomonadota bacterium]